MSICRSSIVASEASGSSNGASIEQRPIINSSIRIRGNASIRPVIESGWRRPGAMARRAKHEGMLIGVNLVEVNAITWLTPGVASITPAAPPSVAMNNPRPPRKDAIRILRIYADRLVVTCLGFTVVSKPRRC